MTEQSEHTHVPNECYQERIQELAESCDNEYYMSASPFTINKERAKRGRTRILQAIEEFKELQQSTKCTICLEEIIKQLALQEEGLKEIEQVWNL